jgi:hypothetical protein
MLMFAVSPRQDSLNPSRLKDRPIPKGLPSELIIGVLVPPVLLGLLASRVLADAVTQVGLVSEQLYRGERLPTLNVSDPETDDK